MKDINECKQTVSVYLKDTHGRKSTYATEIRSIRVDLCTIIVRGYIRVHRRPWNNQN